AYTAYQEFDPDVAMESDGDFVVVWSGRDASQSGILGRRFDSAGVAQAAELQVNLYVNLSQQSASVAVNDSGAFRVTWTDLNGEDGSGTGVFGRSFDSAGNAQGADFQVNSYTGAEQRYPDLVMGADGSFV